MNKLFMLLAFVGGSFITSAQENEQTVKKDKEVPVLTERPLNLQGVDIGRTKQAIPIEQDQSKIGELKSIIHSMARKGLRDKSTLAEVYSNPTVNDYL